MFSGKAPNRVASPSRLRVIRLVALQASPPPLAKNLGLKLRAVIDRVNVGATPPEKQASNMEMNLSALSLRRLVTAAISWCVMTWKSCVSRPSTQAPLCGSCQRVPCPE